MALTNYESFLAPQGQGFITDQDGNRRYYDMSGQWLTPRTGGGIDRQIDLEMLADGGFMRQGGTSDFYRSLGILGQADGGLLEVDINQNPDFAPYVQNIDGKNFVTSEVWHQLRPQNDPGLLGNLALNMPVIMGAAGGLGAAGGFFDPYSLVAAEGGGGGLVTAAEGGNLLGGAGGDMVPGIDWAAVDAGEAVAPWTTNPSVGALGGDVGAVAGGGLTGLSPAEAAVFDTASLPAQTTAANGWSPVGAGGGFLDNLTDQITNNSGRLVGGLLGGGLGYLSAGQQSDALERVANQNLAIGAPFRDRLNQSYAPDFDLMSQPGYGDAFNRMADISTRQWSTRGNPANNPGIQGGILNDVWNQSYLPALSNYRGQLGQFGGLGLNTAGAAQISGANNAGAGLDAIARGIGYGLTPQPNYGNIFGQGNQNQNPFDLSVGGRRWP